jgi:hypothetical protein
MKNLLIVYPHWPPSNLAGVHRARLISNFLPEMGWHPIVLAVHEDFYEEVLDTEILKTVRSTTEVIKVRAKAVKSRKRMVGDITLRAFSELKKKAIELINTRSIDFMWVPIPSFYSAILARQIHNKTGIAYGIDYIDPWVDSFVGQEKIFSKAWLSNRLAHLLEPYSVRKAKLISGVSTPYYQPVLDRNFKNNEISHVGMPYGFDPEDHKVRIEDLKLPWKEGVDAYMYAGAFLPKSHYFLQQLFTEIRDLKEKGKWEKKKQLYFLGTGTYPGKQIREYASEYNISEIVTEINERFPFLFILNFLNRAKGVIVLGSTEEHYTASKIFQSLLSQKPVLGVFHHKSSAVTIMKRCKAANYLVEYIPGKETEFEDVLKKSAQKFFQGEDQWTPDLRELDEYSAKASARALVEKLNALS